MLTMTLSQARLREQGDREGFSQEADPRFLICNGHRWYHDGTELIEVNWDI